MWELNIAGISTPWVAGDWLFVVTDDAKLIAVARADRQGPLDQPAAALRTRRSKRRADHLFGPGPRRRPADRRRAPTAPLINFDPATGSFQSQTSVGGAVSFQPVVANSTLYVLDDDGRLAYR